jgi:hypothetical protein
LEQIRELTKLKFQYAGILSLLLGSSTAQSIKGPRADVVFSQAFAGRSSGSYAATFGGNGQPADGWPLMSQWIPTFTEMLVGKNNPKKRFRAGGTNS